MFEPPTIEDFADVINEPLERALAAAKKATQTVETYYAMTGEGCNDRMIHCVFDAVEAEFDNGIAAAFAEFKLEQQRQVHDAHDAWRALEQQLSLFLVEIQEATNHPWLRACRPLMHGTIDQRLIDFAEKLRRRLQQLQDGSWDESKINDLVILNGNSIKDSAGGASDDDRAEQVVVTGEQLACKIGEFEARMAAAPLSDEQRMSVGIDIDAIKGQLLKSTPNPSMVREAVKSIRTILDGTAAGGLASPLYPAVKELARMVRLP